MPTRRLHASELAQVQRETNATRQPAGIDQDQAARAPASYMTHREEEEALDRIDTRRRDELAAQGDTFALRTKRAHKYWGKHAGP